MPEWSVRGRSGEEEGADSLWLVVGAPPELANTVEMTAEQLARITLVGAVAGVSYVGLLGLLIGPLALTYFFLLLATRVMEARRWE